MNNIWRIVSLSALALGATGLVSATTISYASPVVNCVGTNCTATESGSLSATNFQVGSGTSLFVFYKFLSVVGVPGNATLTSVSFSYQFDNVLSSFQVTNNDVSSDQVTVNILSSFGKDSAGTMTTTDQNAIFGALIANAGFANPYVVASANDQVIAAGDTYVYPGLPSSVSTVASSVALTKANYNTTGAFSFGTTDFQSYSVSNNGSSGSVNLNVLYTSSYDASASVVYNFTIPSASPTPEPATFAMFGSALLGFGFIRRRRR